MLNEHIKAEGNVFFELRNEFGEVKEAFNTNLIVNTGLSYITSRILGDLTPPITHMALGTGTTAASIANTTLENPLGTRSIISASTQVATNIPNDSVQYTCNFAPGIATGGITEAGLFNDETAGIMVARTVFPVINKGPLDVLAIVWKITIY